MKDTALENEWQEVIEPRRGLFDIRLKELWRYRDLIALFVRRDFVSGYKQTILGPIWFFLQPVFTTLVFIIIFTKVARLSTDGLPPVLFYLSGVTLWTYFSDCLLKTSNVFISNAGIFGKVYFPRLASPVSIVISNLTKLCIQFLLLLLIICWYHFSGRYQMVISPWLLLLPVIILLLALLSLGMGIFVSSLTTKYRDLTFLIQFGIQLLMYASPVIFPLSSAEGKLKTLLSLNPLTPIFEGVRFILYGQGTFDAGSLAYCAAFTLIMLATGVVVFNQVEKSFMDTV